MKLTYWTGPATNFGDELNVWLWAQLIPELLDDDDGVLFLGIGSILWNSFPKSSTKVVFGCGFGGYTSPPVVDDTWKIYFVRGRRSADVLGIDHSYGIGDAATLLASCLPLLPAVTKTGRIAFMPHHESAADGMWEAVAAAAGLDFIDPRWDVMRIIAAIRSCDRLVTEAMHGAIVADTLRVPWIPYEPLPFHQMKWYDWADTLGVSFQFTASRPTSWLEMTIRACYYQPNMRRRLRYRGRRFKALGARFFKRDAVKSLADAKASRAYLSDDAAFAKVTSAMEAQLLRLKADFAKAGYAPVS